MRAVMEVAIGIGSAAAARHHGDPGDRTQPDGSLHTGDIAWADDADRLGTARETILAEQRPSIGIERDHVTQCGKQRRDQCCRCLFRRLAFGCFAAHHITWRIGHRAASPGRRKWPQSG